MTSDKTNDLVLCSSCMKREYPLDFIRLEYEVERLPWNGKYPRYSIGWFTGEKAFEVMTVINLN